MWSELGDQAEEFVIDVAVEGARIAFRDGGIRSRLEHGHETTMRAAELTARYKAPAVENYMKTNAPWTDQTGNARNGLFARPYRDGDEVGIVLGHSVFYGIFLEVRFSGRYAIIQPTIDHMGPEVMRAFNRMMDRMN
jgi:hypothetical protein